MKQKVITIQTRGRGLNPITHFIEEEFKGELPEHGLLNVFIQHTSASLMIQENADPSARRDLEEFYDRLAPEGESWHRHTAEGPDDTTSHLKSSLTETAISIPITYGRLGLGTWQGVYLFEHRNQAQERKVVLTLLGF